MTESMNGLAWQLDEWLIGKGSVGEVGDWDKGWNDTANECVSSRLSEYNLPFQSISASPSTTLSLVQQQQLFQFRLGSSPSRYPHYHLAAIRSIKYRVAKPLQGPKSLLAYNRPTFFNTKRSSDHLAEIPVSQVTALTRFQ